MALVIPRHSRPQTFRRLGKSEWIPHASTDGLANQVIQTTTREGTS